MTYLAVCFFSCCCLTSIAAQRWMVFNFVYKKPIYYEEQLQRLSQNVHRTYYNNIITSTRELSVNLSIGQETFLQTRKGYFSAYRFPSSEVRTERNVIRSVYGVKRVTTGEESDPVTCSTRGEPQGDEVPCKINADGMFTCEQTVPVKIDDMLAVMMVLTTEYRSFSALENGSVCVYEVRHKLSLSRDHSFQATEIPDIHLRKVLQPFHEAYILAEVDSKLAVGVVNLDDKCQTNRSAKEDCRAFLRPYENATEKSAILLQMALTPLFEQTYFYGNEFYILAGMRKRTFPNLLLQYQTMKTLDLSFTGISAIDDDYFKGVPQLTFLRLSGNNLTAVPDGIKQLRGLLTLDLSNNPLKNKTQLSQVLQNLTSLEKLDLSDVPLGRLDPLCDSLTSMKLRSLKLSRSLDTVISKATRDLFESMTKLEHLDLSDNPLYYIPEDLFSKMQALKTLHLSNTNLSESFKLNLHRTAFVHLIDLSYNRLTKVNSVDTCGTVLLLKMDHNLIEEWTDTDVFISSRKLPWVMYLNVSYNNIKAITAPMRQSLEVLHGVIISHNPITCECDLKELENWLNKTRHRVLNIEWSRSFGCAPARKCVIGKGCKTETTKLYWYLSIPFAVGLIMLALIRVLSSFRRYQIAYLKYLNQTRNENRNKAIELSKVAFENDVYIVHSLEDTEWVNTVLVPRLENFRVLVADPTEPNGKDLERISNDIQNSRHLLFVVSDSFPQSEYCMHRGLEMGNLGILNGEEHNLIFLMIHGVNRQAFPTNLKLLSSTYDSIDWPKEGKSDAKAFRTLISYLGTSTNHIWKINFINEKINT